MNLGEWFNHRYTGYFLEAAKFLVLLGAVLHVGDRIHTLETGGCEAYYSEFSDFEDFSNKKFFNRSERKELIEPEEEPELEVRENSSFIDHS